MSAPAPTTFAAVLRAELTRRCARNSSYSLRAFARALDVDHATLSQILRGKRALTRDTILELGQRLGLETPRLEAFVRDAEAVRDGPPAYSPSLDAAAIVGDALHHQLLALTHTEDFRGESVFLAQVFDTTPDAINVVLQRLLRFGLLRMTEGRWLDVTGAGELEPEGFERAVWDQAARRVATESAAPSAAPGEDAAAPHPVRQFQILARDPEATASFYQRVFGWEIDQRNAPGVRQLSTGAEGMAGGGSGVHGVSGARPRSAGRGSTPGPPRRRRAGHPGGPGGPTVRRVPVRPWEATVNALVIAVALAASPAEAAPEPRPAAADVEACADGAGLATPGERGVRPDDAPRSRESVTALPGRRRFVVASARAGETRTGSQPTGRTGMDEAMRGIEALRRRDEAASKAYDVKALAELWTADAVALPPGGPVKRGPELRRGLEKMADVARGTEVLDYREVFEETLVFGDTAVEWGHIEGSERDRATGKVTTSRFHLMRILKRVEDGTWRVHRSIFAPAG